MKNRSGKILICEYCKRKFYVPPCRVKTARWCSHRCFSKTKKGKELAKNLKSDNWKGKKRDKKTADILRNNNKGIKRTLDERIKQGNSIKREKHWNWQGGKSKEGKLLK